MFLQAQFEQMSNLRYFLLLFPFTGTSEADFISRPKQRKSLTRSSAGTQENGNQDMTELKERFASFPPGSKNASGMGTRSSVNLSACISLDDFQRQGEDVRRRIRLQPETLRDELHLFTHVIVLG